MPRLLTIDIGSSSVKAAVLLNGRIAGDVARAPLATRFAGDRVEVPPQRIFQSIIAAMSELKPVRIDCVAISSMGPSWVAMDTRGRPLTPVVTHQDRRSVGQARAIERQIGKAKHLRIVGARPVPGGISSTTCRWFVENAPATMRRADLIGHVPTMLLRRWCGVRVIDPSHASFSGMFQTSSLRGWNDELLDAARARRSMLPDIVPANQIAGELGRQGASDLGLPIGTPVLAGILDGSVPMLFAGAANGRVVNVCGSTDVLAVCTDRFQPHPSLLTRALGVGRLWLSVSTIAAAGSSIDWARRVMFSEHDDCAFDRLLARLAPTLRSDPAGVRFEPWLGGDRTEIEPRRAAIENLQLSSGREDILRAILSALRQQSAARLRLMNQLKIRMDRQVLQCGGGDDAFGKIMSASWPGAWRFRRVPDATFAGLARLIS